jgi:anthranilate phosphoribosyltransferase
MDAFKPFLAKLVSGATLEQNEARDAFDLILSGDVTPAQIGGFLIGLRQRGETVPEITGAVAAMRAKMRRVEAPADSIDIVGTGGDGHSTYNVSTLSALIIAACGVPVAKHGNRAASSKSGSSDVLAALGVKLGLAPADVSACIAHAGIGFMWAQAHHEAMRHVATVRAELGTRTIFNLLGPLSNPAGVKHILLGVFSAAWLQPLAEVLRDLGTERAWIVHGSDGLDEITTTGPTQIVALENGAIRSFEVAPEDIALPRARLADLKGGDAAQNAEALKAVLNGAQNPYRDIALFNAAAALVIAGRAANLSDAATLADTALRSGKAATVLAKLVDVSNRDSTQAAAAGH